MVKWVLRKAIGRFEREWNYDAGYVRDIIDASPRAAWLFSRVNALGQFRRDISVDAWCTAGITAVRHEDCGPCTQLAVTMAERAGVSLAVLRAVLADNPAAMRRTSRSCGSSRARRSRPGRRRGAGADRGVRDRRRRHPALYVVRNPDKLRHLAAGDKRAGHDLDAADRRAGGPIGGSK